MTIFQSKKRAPTALTVDCNVCGGPAPDHIHFGGKYRYINFITMKCQCLLIFSNDN